MLKLFLGFRSVCFHVVCPDAGCCSYYLTDKWTIDKVFGESFCKFNNCFTELCSLFFKVVLLFVIWVLRFLWHLSFVIWHCLEVSYLTS